jgi:hypothetical protein
MEDLKADNGEANLKKIIIEFSKTHNDMSLQIQEVLRRMNKNKSSSRHKMMK